MKTKLVILFVAIAGLLNAEPLKMKNTEASELYGTLSAIQSGLSASNTTKVARNINALRSVVEAWVKGDTDARERLHIIPEVTKLNSPEYKAYEAEAKKSNNDTITVELSKLELTEAEINNLKVTRPEISVPSVVANLYLYLDATKAPDKK